MFRKKEISVNVGRQTRMRTDLFSWLHRNTAQALDHGIKLNAQEIIDRKPLKYISKLARWYIVI